MRVNGAREREGLLKALGCNEARRCYACFASGLRKRLVDDALVAQALYVDFAHTDLLVQCEAVGLAQQAAVLVDEGIASEHQILRALAKSAGGVDVASEAAGRLLGNEASEIAVLAHDLVGGGEVEDDVGTVEA
jgi:hypothetical protein